MLPHSASCYQDWLRHPSGFHYGWRGEDLVYHIEGDDLKKWRASYDQAIHAFRCTADVRRFVRMCLADPDAHTRIVVGDGHDIRVCHNNPMFPEVVVCITGVPIYTGNVRTLDEISRQLQRHDERLCAAANDIVGLKARVRVLEETIAAIGSRLDSCMLDRAC
jgi:hypothetical protein